MAYRKYTDEEITAPEKLTIREVSSAYCEEHGMKAAPVVRNRHILMFRRAECGRYFEYRDGSDGDAGNVFPGDDKVYCTEKTADFPVLRT